MCNKISQKLVMNHHFPIILALCLVEQKEVLSTRKFFLKKKTYRMLLKKAYRMWKVWPRSKFCCISVV